MKEIQPDSRKFEGSKLGGSEPGLAGIRGLSTRL